MTPEQMLMIDSAINMLHAMKIDETISTVEIKQDIGLVEQEPVDGFRRWETNNTRTLSILINGGARMDWRP